MPSSQRPDSACDPDVLRTVSEQLRGLRYGMLQITVHDSRVVQIDRVERTRLQEHQPRSRGDAHGA